MSKTCMHCSSSLVFEGLAGERGGAKDSAMTIHHHHNKVYITLSDTHPPTPAASAAPITRGLDPPSLSSSSTL